ncbi:MAG: hypothetical protein ABI343_21685 [Burkholderiaceae bacterium]
MFHQLRIAQLAAELHKTERTRVQVERALVLGGTFTRPCAVVAGDTFHTD